MKVGVIGIGAMGSRVAYNLLKDGLEVYIYNRNSSAAKELVDKGAIICSSAKGVVLSSDIILSFVTDDQASSEIWFDQKSGGHQALDKTKTILECSTLSLSFSRLLIEKFRGHDFLLSPVVGSRPQAESRQLVFLVGGEVSAYQKAKSVIERLSSKTIHFNEAIKASTLKLVINSLFGVQAIAFAEAFRVLEKAGFQRTEILSLLPSLPVTSPAMQLMLSLFNEEKFTPLFPISLVAKDFRYALELTHELGINAVSTQLGAHAYERAVQQGLGELNISAIIKIFKGEEND